MYSVVTRRLFRRFLAGRGTSTAVVTHRKDIHVGMQTRMGLTSNQDATPPQSDALALD